MPDYPIILKQRVILFLKSDNLKTAYGLANEHIGNGIQVILHAGQVQQNHSLPPVPSPQREETEGGNDSPTTHGLWLTIHNPKNSGMYEALTKRKLDVSGLTDEEKAILRYVEECVPTAF